MTVTQIYDFDTIHDRSNTSSIKWTKHYNGNSEMVPLTEGKIPLWVAEMEFPVPPEIREAMKKRIDHGFFGYTVEPEPLKEIIVERMKTLYNWDIESEWILFNPGMVLFVGVVTRALTQPGAGILMSTPAYGPFLSRPSQYQRFTQRVPLQRVDDDANTFHYEIDFDVFEAAITPQTEMFYLCNPHNPIGKSFSTEELQRLGEICVKHDIIIASDDIHCDLMLSDKKHTLITTLSPEIQKNTITMIAGTKVFNMAGNACSVAIVPDKEKREKIHALSYGSSYHVGTLAYEALLAGYRDCDEWLHQLRQYLTDNRDFVRQYVQEHLPMIKTTIPDATYMMWIDFNALDIPDKYSTMTDFFSEEAGVIFSPGSFFGDNLHNYVRLNFAVPRSMLVEALDKVKQAVDKL